MNLYDKVFSGTGYYIWNNSGYLKLSGADRVDFLQRQTTNDLRKLVPCHGLVSVLTSPSARILDVFYLIHEPDSIGVITLPGKSEDTGQYLTDRIFFMDQVKVTNASEAFVNIDIEGEGASDLLLEISFNFIPDLDEYVVAEVDETIITAYGKPGLVRLGYGLHVPADKVLPMKTILEENGAVELSAEEREILRIEVGLPAPRKELHNDYTPLEVNLERAIASDKGCYTGQEVIARQVTYDKVTRRLVGIHMETFVKAGEAVHFENRLIGKISSSILSPRIGPIGLAVLKRPYHQSGTEVDIGDGVDRVKGQVTELPFSPKFTIDS
jgi:folate-binding protein YgfZ